MSFAMFNTGLQSWYATVSASAKATPGRVFSLYGFNANAAVRYLQLFDKASAPASGDVPIGEWALAASGGDRIVGMEAFTVEGITLAKGVAWGISTTRGSYTAATAADHDVSVVLG